MEKARILWVDENLDSSLRYHYMCLETGGFELDKARTMREALDLYTKKHYDLVILDLLMPGGDVFTREETKDGANSGMLLFKKLKAIKKDVPFIIFSAIVDEEVGRETITEIGKEVDGILAKSIYSGPEVLLARVQQVIARPSPGRPSL
ncbi:MAG: response regulator [Candidatus Abyssobacteria bacterium SURF_17]|uniref:Response regulator n=1 Tax=Candidatus Abyssobacteria bacterium SURF_17 TaxID=2093361 RepID=A0A419EU70_9BACT|nr:MAG: response regulator [Candidatus Abyssubacteria bacterium SURF_17]